MSRGTRSLSETLERMGRRGFAGWTRVGHVDSLNEQGKTPMGTIVITCDQDFQSLDAALDLLLRHGAREVRLLTPTRCL